MGSIEVKEQLTRWQDLLVRGEVKPVLDELSKLDRSQVPRSAASTVASLLRRCGDPISALKIQGSFIRDPRENVRATDREVIEYCNSLILLGCSEESLERLDAIQDKNDSEFLYCMILYSMSQWDYEKGLIYANQYLDCDKLPAYNRAIGTLNKMACLIATERHSGAEKFLRAQFEIYSRQGWGRLATNSCDLMYQTAIAQKNWDELEKIQSLLKTLPNEHSTLDSLFIKKWQAIAKAIQLEDISLLEPIYELAGQHQHWETIRSLDYYLLQINFCQQTLDKLWYGTPYLAYRKSLEKKYNSISPSFRIGKSKQEFVLSSGTVAEKKVLKLDSKTHRVIAALTTDLYRPLSGVALFTQVFSDEYFDPEQFSSRVQVVVSRARDWIKKNKIGLSLNKNELGYRLEAQETSIILERERPQSRSDSQLKDFQQIITSHFFQRPDLEKQLGLSRASAQRLLLYGIQHGLIEKFGHGTTTEYRFL